MPTEGLSTIDYAQREKIKQMAQHIREYKET